MVLIRQSFPNYFFGLSSYMIGNQKETPQEKPKSTPTVIVIVIVAHSKKLIPFNDLCVSSLRRGHANLLCIVPIFSDAPRRGSNTNTLTLVWYRDESCLSVNGSNPLSFLTQKELPIGESNPGRERDRLECYQLHQPGLSSVSGALPKMVPLPGFEPGSPRPQRGVLTTRL